MNPMKIKNLVKKRLGQYDLVVRDHDIKVVGPLTCDNDDVVARFETPDFRGIVKETGRVWEVAKNVLSPCPLTPKGVEYLEELVCQFLVESYDLGQDPEVVLFHGEAETTFSASLKGENFEGSAVRSSEGWKVELTY